MPHLLVKKGNERDHREVVHEEKLHPQKINAFDEMVNMTNRKRLRNYTLLLNNNCIHIGKGFTRRIDSPTITESHITLNGNVASICFP